MKVKFEFENHKEKNPVQTVIGIRELLQEISIFPFEVNWNYLNEYYYSTVLLTGLPFKNVNGKGVTKEATLASAYAELIERIQNGMFLPENYGLQKELNINYFDYKKLDVINFIKENEEIINCVFEETKEEVNSFFSGKENVKGVPFYNINTGKINLIPYFILYRNVGSNGMCAGNSGEEALVQGLCEIFERYMLREIVLRKIDTPTIPHSYLKERGIYGLIEPIINNGYNVIVKDCTMAGRYPVLATIIINKEGKKYHINFGSDPIFKVALQRCLTESFQTVNFNAKLKDFTTTVVGSLENMETDNKLNLFYQFRASDGDLFNYLVPGRLDFDRLMIEKAFEEKFTSNKTLLKMLVKRLKVNGNEIYVRDQSFLGFPAYYIYIPGLSELRKIKLSDIGVDESEKIIRDCLLRLNSASNEQLKKCADAIENILPRPIIERLEVERKFFFKRILNIALDDKSQFNRLIEKPYYLLSLLYLRMNNYKKAYYYFGLFIKHSKNDLNYKYCMNIFLYLKMKIMEYPDNKIKNELISLFGEKWAKKVFETASNPENIFDEFVLPDCEDCATCQVKNDCYYDLWYKISKKIKNKIEGSLIKQENIYNIIN